MTFTDTLTDVLAWNEAAGEQALGVVGPTGPTGPSGPQTPLAVNLDCAGHAISDFKNAGSTSNLAVTAGGAQSFPATTLDCAALGLVNGHTYSATFGFRVRQWKDDKSAAGSVDLVEDVLITVAAGVATVAFNRVAVPDPRGLAGTTLSAGTASVTASTGGFTVTVTRGAAVNCHASWRMWCNNFEDLG